jgi:hypothetical protein
MIRLTAMIYRRLRIKKPSFFIWIWRREKNEPAKSRIILKIAGEKLFNFFVF